VKIVLTGFRGTGKSAIGRRLAGLLDLAFLDTDEQISRTAGMEIGEIFTQCGESHFRDLERSVIRSLAGYQGVISSGGGAVLDPGNVEHLRKNGTVILLTAEPATIEARIANGKRPALTPLPLKEEIVYLLGQRRDAYLAAADFCIPTDGKSPGAVAQEIMQLLHGRPIPADAAARGSSLLAGIDIPRKDRDILNGALTRREKEPTRILGIVGNPCRHSRSPHLYNELFRRYGLRMHYTRFETADLGGVMRLARLLDMRALSVTIPFKVEVRGYLDEEDVHSRAIGACNTVIFCGGKVYGYNTDWIGVKKPVEHLRGSRAALVGAGGAAAAAAYALRDLAMDVTVYARDPQKGKDLAERFGFRHSPYGTAGRIDADLIVHATPVGMDGDSRTLLSAEQIPEGSTVFDLVYTPPMTPLLHEAGKAGARIIYGTEMFVHQACEQFRLCTGIKVPEDSIREVLR
jgi:shikimate dehydrogenase